MKGLGESNPKLVRIKYYPKLKNIF